MRYEPPNVEVLARATATVQDIGIKGPPNAPDNVDPSALIRTDGMSYQADE